MARIFDGVVGHKSVRESLDRAYLHGHFPSLLLMSGPEGVGKKRFALALAQALVCEKSMQSLAACGECGPCLRAEKNESESLLLIEPIDNNIKIEQSRRIHEFLSLQKLGRSRVVVIDQVHLLNPTAANSLLKILEETTAGTYFFLVTNAPLQVMATIRSRTQQLRFGPLSNDDLSRLGYSGDLSLARGRVGLADKLGDPEWQKRRLQAFEFLQEACEKRPRVQFSSIKELAKTRDYAQQVIDSWATLFRDVWQIKNGGSEILNSDQTNIIESLAKLGWMQLGALTERLHEMSQELAQNVDRSLLLEDFYFRLGEYQ